MATNFVQEGDIVDMIATETRVSGSCYSLNDTTMLVGVAINDIANAATGPMALKKVWELPVATGETGAIGTKMYLIKATNLVTTVSTGNILAGYLTEAKAAGPLVCKVMLNGRLT